MPHRQLAASNSRFPSICCLVKVAGGLSSKRCTRSSRYTLLPPSMFPFEPVRSASVIVWGAVSFRAALVYVYGWPTLCCRLPCAYVPGKSYAWLLHSEPSVPEGQLPNKLAQSRMHISRLFPARPRSAVSHILGCGWVPHVTLLCHRRRLRFFLRACSPVSDRPGAAMLCSFVGLDCMLVSLYGWAPAPTEVFCSRQPASVTIIDANHHTHTHTLHSLAHLLDASINGSFRCRGRGSLQWSSSSPGIPKPLRTSSSDTTRSGGPHIHSPSSKSGVVRER